MATYKFVGESALKELIAKCKTLSWEIQPVNELPETGESHILYLVPVSGGKTKNVFDEYIWVESTSSFEKFGSGTLELDLDNYAKKSDFDSLKEYLDKLSETVEKLGEGEVTDIEFDTDDAPEITFESSVTEGVAKVKVTTDLSGYAKSEDVPELEEITADEVDGWWEE